jgi:hypothetical protein
VILETASVAGHSGVAPQPGKSSVLYIQKIYGQRAQIGRQTGFEVLNFWIYLEVEFPDLMYNLHLLQVRLEGIDDVQSNQSLLRSLLRVLRSGREPYYYDDKGDNGKSGPGPRMVPYVVIHSPRQV